MTNTTYIQTMPISAHEMTRTCEACGGTGTDSVTIGNRPTHESCMYATERQQFEMVVGSEYVVIPVTAYGFEQLWAAQEFAAFLGLYVVDVQPVGPNALDA
jgi:hypothetical protein